MNTLMIYAAGAAVFFALRAISDRVDDRLRELERTALDETIRWAYTRGWADGTQSREHGPGVEVTVAEFRDRYGVERREVRK